MAKDSKGLDTADTRHLDKATDGDSHQVSSQLMHALQIRA